MSVEKNKPLKGLLSLSMLKVKKIKGWKDTSLHTAPFFQTSLELFTVDRNTPPPSQQWGCPIHFSIHSQKLLLLLPSAILWAHSHGSRHFFIQMNTYCMSPIRSHNCFSGIILPAALLKTSWYIYAWWWVKEVGDGHLLKTWHCHLFQPPVLQSIWVSGLKALVILAIHPSPTAAVTLLSSSSASGQEYHYRNSQVYAKGMENLPTYPLQHQDYIRSII